MIEEILDNIYVLPRSSKDVFLSHVHFAEYKKGEVLVSPNRTERHLYFIRKGFVRAFIERDGNEITFWFGYEGTIFTSLNSLIYGKAGYEYIELLEDCELYFIPIKELKSLFTSDIHISNWGRSYVEIEFVKTENEMISRQFSSAMERYEKLLCDHPQIINRVKLGHIASYLGITQVSLSRIRAELK